MFACVPKQIYAPMMLIPFLLPLAKIKNKSKYYIICILPFIITFISLLVRTGAEISSAGDTRIAGSAVNPAEQLNYIMGNIMEFLRMLVKFMMDFVSLGYIQTAFTNFAHLSNLRFGSSTIMVMIIVLSVLDKKECDRNIKAIPRIYTALLFVGVSVLIAVAFYLVATPVGSSIFVGTQSRYITPLIYPLVSIAASGKYLPGERIRDRKLAGVLICCILIVIYASNLTAINIHFLS